MKMDVPDRFAAPLPRRDIVAICIYINRSRGTKPVDSGFGGPGALLDRVVDAARMQ